MKYCHVLSSWSVTLSHDFDYVSFWPSTRLTEDSTYTRSRAPATVLCTPGRRPRCRSRSVSSCSQRERTCQCQCTWTPVNTSNKVMDKQKSHSESDQHQVSFIRHLEKKDEWLVQGSSRIHKPRIPMVNLQFKDTMSSSIFFMSKEGQSSLLQFRDFCTWPSISVKYITMIIRTGILEDSQNKDPNTSFGKNRI